MPDNMWPPQWRWILWSSHGFSAGFQNIATIWPLCKVLLIDLWAFQRWNWPEHSTRTSNNWEVKVQNREMKGNTFMVCNKDVSHWVNQSHPSPNRPHHHYWLAYLWISCPRQLTCLPLMKTTKMQADGLQCGCEHVSLQLDRMLAEIMFKKMYTDTCHSFVKRSLKPFSFLCPCFLPKLRHLEYATPVAVSVLSGKRDMTSHIQTFTDNVVTAIHLDQ